MSDQSPPVQVSAVFPYQSYFDNTLLDTAVQLQGAGRSILDNAATPAKDSDVGGYGVALDPSSETPIAISFKSKQGSGTSAAVILRPGQSVFPFGRGANDAFSGFRWGLPLGWLGGGLVTLTVLQSPRAEMEWAGLRRQMIFHRMTLPILAKGATIIATNISPNWPLRFPSIGTRRTSQSGIVSQALAPVLAVEPTLTLVRLVPMEGNRSGQFGLMFAAVIVAPFAKIGSVIRWKIICRRRPAHSISARGDCSTASVAMPPPSQPRGRPQRNPEKASLSPRPNGNTDCPGRRITAALVPLPRLLLNATAIGVSELGSSASP